MKKNLLLYVSFIFTSTIWSQSLKQDTPEEIGIGVFELLSKIDTMSLEVYSKHYLTLKEIRSHILDDNLVPEYTKLKISRISKFYWDKEIEEDYDQMKNRGKYYNIDFSKIVFKNFEYFINSNYSYKDCNGNLTFIFNGIVYNVGVYTFFNGKEYILRKLTRVTEIKK